MQSRGAHLKEADSGCGVVKLVPIPLKRYDPLGTYMDPEGKTGKTGIMTPASQKQLMVPSQTSRSPFKAKPN